MDGKIINTRTAKVSKISDEIIKVEVLENSEVNEIDARENYETVRNISGGKRVAVLIDSRTETTATKEAREFSAGEEVSAFVIARAILTDSLPVTLLGNFYANQPLSPTRLFKDQEEALEWLNNQLKEYHSNRND